jgi:hypothetical protein
MTGGKTSWTCRKLALSRSLIRGRHSARPTEQVSINPLVFTIARRLAGLLYALPWESNQARMRSRCSQEKESVWTFAKRGFVAR